MSRLLVGSATDVGLVRTNNQDQLLVAPGLYAVADGMGGHAAGEVASATAVTALQAAFAASDQRSAESLQNAAKAANRAVWEQARANRRMLGMGTTLVALAVVERQDGTSGLAVAHIGDSRVYLFRDGVLRQLTVDHSLVQELLDDGQISPAQAAIHPQRHVLTRALGVEPSAEVDLVEVSPQHGDRYVLCSDGLPREASDEQIAAVLRRFEDPNDAAKELVCLANSAGGSDNITVVVVDVLANEGAIDALTVPPGPAWQGASESGDRDDGRPLGGSGANSEEVGGDDDIEDVRRGGATAVAVASAPTPIEPLALAGPGVHPPTAGKVEPPSGRLRPLPRLPHPITWRVVGFVAAIAIVVGGALACLAWYARSSYFVTISAGRLAIFQGRPGGVLWFEPTLALRTGYSPSSVDAYWLQTLQAGQPEPSLNQAQLYINRLVSEKREAEAVTPPSAKGPPREHAAPPSPKARARNGAARQARSSRGRARASRTSA